MHSIAFFLMMGWRDLFEMVIVSARKPEFFQISHPLYEVVTNDGLLRPCFKANSVCEENDKDTSRVSMPKAVQSKPWRTRCRPSFARTRHTPGKKPYSGFARTEYAKNNSSMTVDAVVEERWCG